MITPILTLFFSVFGFFLLGGRASQTNSLYLFGVILPWLVFHRRIRAHDYPLLTLGIVFMIMHWLFPLHNLLIAWGYDYPLSGIVGPQIRDFLKGEFSSCVGISGFLMILCWLWARFMNKKPLSGELATLLSPFEAFTLGILVSSIVLFVYGLVQYTTGFDFYDIAAFRADRLLPNGFYRISGFSIHPIPFSGMTLAIFCLYLGALLSHDFERRWIKVAAYVIAAIHLILTFLSGSRIAAIVAVLILLYSLTTRLRLKTKAKALIFAMVVLLIIGATIYSGLIYRFQETLGNSAFSGLGERATFWKVHAAIIAHSPFCGCGKYWLEMMRESYYNKLGYQDFIHKYNAHNIYLELLAQIGISGVAIIAGCLLVCLRSLRKVARVSRTPALYGALGLALISQLIFGLTQNTFGDAPVDLVLVGFLWILFWNDLLDSA